MKTFKPDRSTSALKILCTNAVEAGHKLHTCYHNGDVQGSYNTPSSAVNFVQQIFSWDKLPHDLASIVLGDNNDRNPLENFSGAETTRPKLL